MENWYEHFFWCSSSKDEEYVSRTYSKYRGIYESSKTLAQLLIGHYITAIMSRDDDKTRMKLRWISIQQKPKNSVLDW
jgi:hypothetical protein